MTTFGRSLYQRNLAIDMVVAVWQDSCTRVGKEGTDSAQDYDSH